MCVMNARKASELVGITYGQLRYFVRQIDAFPKKETSQGHDHEFTFRDLVYLKLAAIMRADGITLDEINDAINGLYWRKVDVENAVNAGNLVYTGSEINRWIWTKQNIITAKDFESGSPLNSLPKCFYSISSIVREVELF